MALGLTEQRVGSWATRLADILAGAWLVLSWRAGLRHLTSISAGMPNWASLACRIPLGRVSRAVDRVCSSGTQVDFFLIDQVVTGRSKETVAPSLVGIFVSRASTSLFTVAHITSPTSVASNLVIVKSVSSALALVHFGLHFGRADVAGRALVAGASCTSRPGAGWASRGGQVTIFDVGTRISDNTFLPTWDVTPHASLVRAVDLVSVDQILVWASPVNWANIAIHIGLN